MTERAWRVMLRGGPYDRQRHALLQEPAEAIVMEDGSLEDRYELTEDHFTDVYGERYAVLEWVVPEPAEVGSA